MNSLLSVERFSLQFPKTESVEVDGFSPSLGVLRSVRHAFLSPVVDYKTVSRKGELKTVKEVKYEGFISGGDLEVLISKYEQWVSQLLYLVFHNKEDHNKKVFRLVSKRGNSVYAWKIKKRLEKATAFFESEDFKKLLLRKEGHSWVSNALFLTLTNDSKLYGEVKYYKTNLLGEKEFVFKEGDRIRAWGNGEKGKGIQADYNRFITAFRKRYGKTWVLKSFESFKSGYPHVHLLLITEKSWKVKATRKRLTLKDNSVRWISQYRLGNYKEKESIARLWHSFVDIKAPHNINSVKNYVFKDIIKQFKSGLGVEKDKQNELTLTLNWLFRKRAFSVSGAKIISDLINVGLTQTQTVINLGVFDDYEFEGLVILRINTKDPPFLIEKTLNEDLEGELRDCIR